MVVLNEYNDMNTVELYADFTENIGLLNIEKYLVDKYANAEAKILDVGCGCGRVTFGLYEIGYKQIIGIDVCTNMINQAIAISKERKINVNFINKDIKGYDGEEYDLICFFFNGLMVNPTKENRKKIVECIIKHIKKDGCFIFTTPMMPEDYEVKYEYENYKDSSYSFGFEYGDRIYDGRYYIHFPSDDEILDTCKALSLVETDICENVCSQGGRGYSLTYREKYWVFRR